MAELITEETLRSIFFHHPFTRSVVGAIQTAVTGRPISSEERTVLKGVEGLDEDSILMGFFERMGVPFEEIEPTLTDYKSALDGRVHSQETTGSTFFKFGNYASARTWWTRAAKGGSKMARFQLGILYLTGKGGPSDPGRAEDIFKSFTNDSDKEFKSKSYHNLGLIFSVGKRLEEMEHCFSEAAKLDNVNSLKNMGEIHYKRGEMEKAKQMYQRVHDLGDPCGTFRLARFAKDSKEAIMMVVKAAKNGSWRAKVYVAYRVLLGRSALKDFQYVQKLLNQTYPQIPTTHEVKYQVLNLLWYLETFGDGTDPSEDPGFLMPYQIDAIMKGEYQPIPEIRTVEEDACWARDCLDFAKARTLFTVASEGDGKDSPRVHFNLGMIYYHALGDDTGKVNPVKALIHLNQYIHLTEPNYLHAQVLTMMDDLVKMLIKVPTAIPMLKNMGFVK